eukprot:scaffold4636_cov81-Isochrysis_galbana.AAC.6
MAAPAPRSDNPPLTPSCARSMAILSNPDAKGMRTLQGTLKRGVMDIGDFVDADGPSALLDVVSDVLAKPTMSWLDREVKTARRRTRWEIRPRGPRMSITVCPNPTSLPKPSQVLDGALEALLELIKSEDGAASLLEAEGAFDKLVGALANPEPRIRSKVRQPLSQRPDAPS